MKRADLERYKTCLLAKRSQLIQRARGKELELRESDQRDRRINLTEDDAAIGVSAEESVAIELLAGDRDTIDAIDAALQRIAFGNYGICLNSACGEPIPIKRLDAVPYATLCMSCQRKREGNERGGSHIPRESVFAGINDDQEIE